MSVRRSGFTLIEFLVVVGLLAITVGSTLLFLTSILRGTNQTNISSEVKQNGQAVLDSLERQIRGAKSAIALSPLPGGSAVSGVVLANTDSTNLYITCFGQTASENGWIGSATQAVGAGVPSVNDYKTVTNKDPVSGINIICAANSFSITPATTLSADVVKINFTADKPIKSPSRSDFNAKSDFQTTISLRKY